jgi:hypothetical protein
MKDIILPFLVGSIDDIEQEDAAAGGAAVSNGTPSFESDSLSTQVCSLKLFNEILFCVC